MTAASVLAPLALATVLVLSSLAKWPHPESTRSAIRLLKLPKALDTEGIARALPVGELALALGLITPWAPVAQLASVAALALFVVFLVLVARAMTFDPRPGCGCFGKIGSPISVRTVVRNVVFVALAVVTAWRAFADVPVPQSLSAFTGAQWAWLLGACVIAVAAGLIGADSGGPTAGHSHSHKAKATQVQDELEYIRQPIPPGVLISPTGAPSTLHELIEGAAQLLIFANCNCGPTFAAAARIDEWKDRLPGVDVRLVLSTIAHTGMDDLDIEDAWRDHGALAWRALRLAESPAAVLLGADGLLAGGPVDGIAEIELFVDDIAASLASQPMPLAPEAENGQVVASEEGTGEGSTSMIEAPEVLESTAGEAGRG